MAILDLLIRAAVPALLAMLESMIRDKRASESERDAGAAQTAANTEIVIGRIADAQARNNARTVDVHSIADGLRRSAANGGAVEHAGGNFGATGPDMPRTDAMGSSGRAGGFLGH